MLDCSLANVDSEISMLGSVRSSDYHGRKVLVARRHCPDLGGQWRAATKVGVSCVARSVRHLCPSLYQLAACGNDNGRILCHLSCSMSLS